MGGWAGAEGPCDSVTEVEFLNGTISIKRCERPAPWYPFGVYLCYEHAPGASDASPRP